MTQLFMENLLETVIDHRGKTPHKLGSSFTSTGVPVVSAVMVKNGSIDFSECRFVSPELATRWMPVPTRRGDVLLTSEAPLGRVARVPSDDPLVLGQRIFGLRGLPGVLDSAYLYFALQDRSMQAQLAGLGTGTTVVGIRQSALRKLRLTIPDIRVQQGISGVLGALDEKITVNSRVSRIARELARLQFEAIPATDKVPKKLGDVLALNYGKSLPASARTAGVATVVGSGGPVGMHEKGLVDGPCVVVGRKGSVGSTYWIPGPTFPIDTTFFVEPKEGVSLIYCYYLLKSLDLAGMNSDSAVPGLNRGEALALPVTVPHAAAMGKAGDRATGLFSLATQHDAESHTFDKLRDTLLPALVSGRLRLKDAERQVEDAV